MKKQKVTHKQKIALVSRHLRVWGKEESQTLMRWFESKIKDWTQLPKSEWDKELFCLLCSVSPAIDPKDLGLKRNIDANVNVQRRIKALKIEFLSVVLGNLSASIKKGDFKAYRALLADLCGLGDFLKMLVTHGIIEESERLVKSDPVMAFALGRTATVYMKHTGALDTPEAQKFVEDMNRQLREHLLTLLKRMIKQGKQKSALILLDMLEQV